MEKLLTVREAAEYLSIHPKHLYRIISERLIPFIWKKKIGYRLRESDLMEWLQEDFNPPSGWEEII